MSTQNRNTMAGLTKIEVIVVITALFLLAPVLLAFMLLPATASNEAKARRIRCVNNLKQLGMAYQAWAGDNAGCMPFARNIKDGGWSEYLLKTNAAAFLWTNYAVMADELGQDPRVLMCPSDEKRIVPATFAQLKDNRAISYLVGVTPGNMFTNSILGGDRNIAPGMNSMNDLGFSSNDRRGTDVTLQTNSPVCWSLRIHSRYPYGVGTYSTMGAGNLLLGDGSVQQTSSGRLRLEHLPVAGVPLDLDVTNSVVSYPSLRLLFP